MADELCPRANGGRAVDCKDPNCGDRESVHEGNFWVTCAPMEDPPANLCGAGENACAPGCCKERDPSVELPNDSAHFPSVEQMGEVIAEAVEAAREQAGPTYIDKVDYVAEGVDSNTAVALSACLEVLKAGGGLMQIPAGMDSDRVQTAAKSLVGDETVLAEAARIISGPRAAYYGPAWDNHQRIADLWSVYLNHRFGINVKMLPHDAGLMMDLMKTARLIESPTHRDSFVDKLGYSSLSYDMANKAIELGLI